MKNCHQNPPESPTRVLYYKSQPHTPNHMEDTLWTEIMEAPGEIWDMDIPELRDEDDDEQSWNEFVNSNVTL
jgi:hypothetical protein